MALPFGFRIIWIGLILLPNIRSEQLCNDAMSNVPDGMIVSCSLRCAKYGYEIESRDYVPHRVQYFHLTQINFTEARCVDKQRPRFLTRCPHSLVFLAEIGSRSADVTWELKTIDNSGSTPQVNCTHDPGEFDVGEYDVTCKASDEAGNMAKCEFHVSVRSAGCPNLNTPGNGSLRCDEWQYGKLCFQECDQTYDIPPGSMFPNLFVCGTAGIWTPGNVPDCIMPIEAKGLVLEAELRLYTADCNDVIKTKFKEAFDNLIKSVDVLAVCEWPEGCVIENVSVDCAPAVHIETTMGTDMGLHEGGMNVIDTSDGGAAQDEPYWYQRAQDGGSQPRLRRDEAGLNSLGNHHDWGYTLNISFSFSLNFSAESLQSGTGYDWLTYLGSKELYDSAVFMQTQIESRMISLEIPGVEWEFQDDSFHYEFVSPYCSGGFMPSWKTMKCSACVAGTYHNQTLEDCIACPLGSYQDEAGQESCKPCPNSGTTEEGKMADSLQSCI